MNRLISASLLFVILGLFSLNAQEDPIDSFEAANRAYLEGDYFLARNVYESAVEAGIESADIFYNLAAIQYQSGQIGDAMLYFRRAQRFEPRNTETNKMIARIRAERVDYQSDDRNVIDQMANATVQIVTIQELTLLVFITWNLFFALAVIRFQYKRLQKWLQPALILTGLLLALGLLLWIPRQYAETSRPSAIVTAIIAPVMSGPGERYLELYRIYAAAEIRVLETQASWHRFVLPDDREGWISDKDVVKV